MSMSIEPSMPSVFINQFFDIAEGLNEESHDQQIQEKLAQLFAEHHFIISESSRCTGRIWSQSPSPSDTEPPILKTWPALESPNGKIYPNPEEKPLDRYLEDVQGDVAINEAAQELSGMTRNEFIEAFAAGMVGVSAAELQEEEEDLLHEIYDYDCELSGYQVDLTPNQAAPELLSPEGDPIQVDVQAHLRGKKRPLQTYLEHVVEQLRKAPRPAAPPVASPSTSPAASDDETDDETFF